MDETLFLKILGEIPETPLTFLFYRGRISL